MRIQYLSESENVSRSEFKLSNKNLEIQLKAVKGDVASNKESIDKLSHILIGNGDVGLLEKVNVLFLRNHWADKAFWVAMSILINIFTLYLSGVLHL